MDDREKRIADAKGHQPMLQDDACGNSLGLHGSIEKVCELENGHEGPCGFAEGFEEESKPPVDGDGEPKPPTPQIEVTEQHQTFLKARGYAAETLEFAKNFIAKFNPEELKGFLHDFEEWVKGKGQGQSAA